MQISQFFCLCIISTVLIGCSASTISSDANPGWHPKLHTFQGDPLRLEETELREIEDDLTTIIDQTDLQIDRMNEDLIVETARNMSYLGRHGDAIRLYEDALQQEYYQGAVVFQHNLAKAYESIQAWDYAIGRYTYLIASGHTNYETDILRAQKFQQKAD